MPNIAVIVSTYEQPAHLARSLYSLSLQSHSEFEVLIADDGSGPETKVVVDEFSSRFRSGYKHLWQTDQGFRKTRILNKALLASQAEYVIFMDGDCVAHPNFVREHERAAKAGHYLNGSLIRLNSRVTRNLGRYAIKSGLAFTTSWLTFAGLRWDRRFLRFSLNYKIRNYLNTHTRTRLYWLGSNSSCFRSDALAVNGFDNRFSYGFEDGDFGNRLENMGVQPRTVRWTANVLHLEHERPYSSPEVLRRNLARVAEKTRGGRYWIDDGASRLA